MIFPYGDDQIKGGAKPIFAYGFIAINILVFLFQITLAPEGLSSFFKTYGAIPAELRSGEDLFTLITNIFIHGDAMHLFGNMLMMWIFADNIEATIGNLNFILFYFIGGVVATFAHALYDFSSVTPAIGASGALAACMGAYLVMFPKSQIKILVIYFFKSFKIPALAFLGLWIAKELASGLGIIGGGGNIAYWAHIGGFAFGTLAGYFAKQAYPVNADMTIGDTPSAPGRDFV